MIADSSASGPEVSVSVRGEELSYLVKVTHGSAMLVAVEVFSNSIGPVACLRSYCCAAIIERLLPEADLTCIACGHRQPCSDGETAFFNSLPAFVDLLELWVEAILAHGADPLTSVLYTRPLASRIADAHGELVAAHGHPRGEKLQRATVEASAHRSAGTLTAPLLA